MDENMNNNTPDNNVTDSQSINNDGVYYSNTQPTNNYYNDTVQSAPAEVKTGFAITSLVMGILSVTCCCGSLLTSVLGIVFYCVQEKDSMGKKPTMATVGLVLSIIGVVFSIIFLGLYFTGALANYTANLQ